MPRSERAPADRPVSDREIEVLAAALEHAPAGGEVGVIVWGRGNAVTGLEIYDLGAGPADLRLPDPASIRPFWR